MLAKPLAIAVVLAALSAPPSPVSAALLDESAKMKGHVVVEAGEMRKLDCPIYGDYDCTTWPLSLYRLGRFCFSISGFVSGFSPIGILATNEHKVTSAFVVEGSYGPKISKHSIVLYNCPDVY